mmetsp:Transcript_87627/g.248443  ORF Transcript_87627/g.248443 Transcript_87627/m.248443 type:complete len:530 (+) Transcript_87627:254-1843(+)
MGRAPPLHAAQHVRAHEGPRRPEGAGHHTRGAVPALRPGSQAGPDLRAAADGPLGGSQPGEDGGGRGPAAGAAPLQPRLPGGDGAGVPVPGEHHAAPAPAGRERDAPAVRRAPSAAGGPAPVEPQGGRGRAEGRDREVRGLRDLPALLRLRRVPLPLCHQPRAALARRGRRRRAGRGRRAEQPHLRQRHRDGRRQLHVGAFRAHGGRAQGVRPVGQLQRAGERAAVVHRGAPPLDHRLHAPGAAALDPGPLRRRAAALPHARLVCGLRVGPRARLAPVEHGQLAARGGRGGCHQLLRPDLPLPLLALDGGAVAGPSDEPHVGGHPAVHHDRGALRAAAAEPLAPQRLHHHRRPGAHGGLDRPAQLRARPRPPARHVPLEDLRAARAAHARPLGLGAQGGPPERRIRRPRAEGQVSRGPLRARALGRPRADRQGPRGEGALGLVVTAIGARLLRVPRQAVEVCPRAVRPPSCLRGLRGAACGGRGPEPLNVRGGRRRPPRLGEGRRRLPVLRQGHHAGHADVLLTSPNCR